MLNLPIKTESYAILHKQICDNFSQCPAMLACEESAKLYKHPTAIYMNEDGKIDINKEYCIGCAFCIKKCGLFRIVSSLYKELEFQKEFDNDPRNNMNFSIERFGCDVINKQEYLLNNLQDINEYINKTQSNKVNILEFVDESLVMCPFQAVEVDYIRNQFSCIGEYKKYIFRSSDIEIMLNIKKNFLVTKFPAIVLISNGKILGKPIDIEFRVSSEDQRINVQNILYAAFDERLTKVGNI